MFIDRIVLKLQAGKGGNGVVAWKREKYIPKGGPTGGNGGNGGDIVLEADENISSLDHFRNQRLIRGNNGKQGGPNKQIGGAGRKLILKVPVGTLVKNTQSEEIIFDFDEHKKEMLICRGGKGGRGNESYKTPTNRAPAKCTPGLPGDEISIELELKLIADVGLVGFPNAGKSTLIKAVSKVPVKIAAYPFTTLQPNLGLIEFDDFSRILIADIPGIIQGASENKGLGLEFLRHIERTNVLVYVIDIAETDGRSCFEDYIQLKSELKKYDPELLNKPYLVVLNKIDSAFASVEENIAQFLMQYSDSLDAIFQISALESIGTEKFMNKLQRVAQADGKHF